VPVLLAAILLRAATEQLPSLSAHRTLADQIVIPGRPPTLAWPREGQAAVEVQGVGSFGTAGAQTPVPIASVAKMMTAYLTLREHPISAGQSGFTLTVTGAEAAEEEQRESEGQSVVPVRPGESLTERQALQALMLPSANNVAAMLARYDAGGIEAFIARMNAQARALGMRSTTYTDPSGFMDTTLSTAADQLKLARVAMKDPTFAAIVDKRAATLPVAGTVRNYDTLLGEEGYVGVKTGSDRAAGGCLVFAKRFTLAGRRLTVLGVVLGQRAGSLIEAAIASARQLGDSAAAAVRVETVLPAGSQVLAVSSTDGRRTVGRAGKTLKEIGWPGLRPLVRVRLGHLGTQARAGQQLASVKIAGLLGTATPVLAAGSIGAPSLGWRLAHLL
jgi:D-alanyl-D-alanine carboxypeptidase (penicillin-binding protein 5/6)